MPVCEVLHTSPGRNDAAPAVCVVAKPVLSLSALRRVGMRFDPILSLIVAEFSRKDAGCRENRRCALAAVRAPRTATRLPHRRVA